MEQNKNFKTVLVIGGAGYIGSHTVWELLKKKNYNIIVYDNYSWGFIQSLKEIEKMYNEFKENEKKEQKKEDINFPTFKIIKGDILNDNELELVFKNNIIDAVMHFSCLITIPESIKNPLLHYSNNLMGTIKLLNTMKKYNVKIFIFTSTAAIFGKPESKKIPIESDCDKQPIFPYENSILMIEKILKDLDNTNNFKSISLRFFNACGADKSGRIGESHYKEFHLIPLILQVPLNKRKQIYIFGTDYPTKDGTCIRDFVHVTDIANAHILSLEYLLKGKPSTCLNLGSGQGFSVKQIIEVCREVTGHKIPAIEKERRLGDPPILKASSKKAEQLLGWKKQYNDIKEIIETAWNWHKTHPNGYE